MRSVEKISQERFIPVKKLYEEIRMKYLELERAMLEEYEKLSAKQDEVRVVSELSLKKAEITVWKNVSKEHGK